MGQDQEAPNTDSPASDFIETQLSAASWIRVSSSVSRSSSFALCKNCRKLSDLLAQLLFDVYKPDDGLDLNLDLVLDPTLCELCDVFSQLLNTFRSREIPRPDSFGPQFACKISRFGDYYLGNARIICGFRCDLETPDGLQASCYAAKGCRDEDMNFLGGENNGIRPIPGRVNYAQIQGWLDDCSEQHGESCNLRQDVEIPEFRLIDCEKHIIVTLPATTRYAALSYVWGAPTEDNEALRLPGKMPKVIEDAIRIIQALGYRYLWVDKYCIPQHDMAAKAAQIQNMGIIYKNADITIISAAGYSSADGIPGVSSIARAKVPLLCMELDRALPLRDGNTTPIITFQPQPSQWIQHEVLNSVWNTRGWTYQEGILSRRRLVFTPTQTYFECQSCRRTASEEGSFSISRVYDIGVVKHSEALFANLEPDAISFERIVSEYLARHLTFESDRLFAAEGLLAELGALQPAVGNLYGLPLFPFLFKHSPTPDTLRLIFGLAFSWHGFTVDKPDPNEPDPVPTRRQGFPSWSWLGWNRPKGRDVRWWTSIVRPGWIHPDSLRYFAHASIALKFQDDEVMPWEGNADEAFLFHTADDLKCLRVTAPVIELLLPPGIESSTSESITCKRFVLDRKTAARALKIQRVAGGLDMLQGKNDCLCCVILASYFSPSFSSRRLSTVSIIALVVREVSGLRGYERVEYIELVLELEPNPGWDTDYINTIADLDEEQRDLFMLGSDASIRKTIMLF